MTVESWELCASLTFNFQLSTFNFFENFQLSTFNFQLSGEGIAIIYPHDVYYDTEYRALMNSAGVKVLIGPKNMAKITADLAFSTDKVDLRYGSTPLSPTLQNTWHLEPLQWSSSDEKVVSVDAEGNLTVNSLGSATISVAYAGDDQFHPVSASYQVNVLKGLPVVSFAEASLTVRMDAVPQQWPVATVNVENAELTYSSVDTGVATVDAKTGAVTLVRAGSTAIIATYAGNSFYEAAQGSYNIFKWTMDNGQWIMDNGQWTMDNGQWTMDNGQWTMNNG